MTNGRATYIQKREARRMYEEDGEAFAAIGRHFGYSAASVSKWASKEGWVKAGTEPVDDSVHDDPTVWTEVIDEPEPVVAAPAVSDTDLRRKVRELEERNARLSAENEKLKPSVDISAMFKDRVKWLTDNSPEGERYWLNRAEAKFKNDNMERAKQGLPVFNIKDQPELLDDLIAELKTKEAIAGSKEPDEPPSRKVKLYIKREGQMPVIEQIPMENQVNNMAGSLADGIVRYTRKGFKLTDPFLCPRAGCFKPASTDEINRWLYDGYCSDRHRTEVEGADKSPTIGLQAKDTVLSGIG